MTIDYQALGAVDTPTICNALEVVMGERTAEGFTLEPVVALDPELPPIVGHAVTVTIEAATPAPDLEAARQMRLEYYRRVGAAAAGRPTVVVIQDTDDVVTGAWWGEVHVAVHKGLGVQGILTNGCMRDLGEVDDGFQILAGSVLPSHAFVHVTSIGEPVEVFGLRVETGDLIHADRHGAVRISEANAEALPDAIQAIHDSEAPLLAAARTPGFDLDALMSIVDPPP